MLQLDASELATGPLAQWPSGAESSLLAEQSDPDKQPSVIARAVNGQHAVRFDGSNDRLMLNDNIFADTATPKTLFVVFSSDDYQGHLIGTGADTTGLFMSHGFALGLAANKPFIKAKNNNSGSWLLSSENVKARGPQIVATSISNAGSEIRSGCHITRSNTMPMQANLAAAYIGGVHDGAESFAGDIAEILLYDRALSAEEHNEVWNYLAEKYEVDAPPATDANDNGTFDVCDTGAVYLKAPAITVALETPNALRDGTLANIINAASPTVADPHTTTSHVWSQGDTTLLFDLQGNYQLEKIHFWNFNEENYDVDAIEFRFLDSAQELISQITVTPQIGFGDILAEDFSVTVSGVRYVRARLTATNGQVEFQNIGFSGVLEGTAP